MILVLDRLIEVLLYCHLVDQGSLRGVTKNIFASITRKRDRDKEDREKFNLCRMIRKRERVGMGSEKDNGREGNVGRLKARGSIKIRFFEVGVQSRRGREGETARPE